MEEYLPSIGECYEVVEQADHKTEAVLFRSRKQVENIILDVGQCTITSQPCIKYLGVMLGTKLSFKPHVEHTAVKPAKVATSLAGLMPNIGGPRQSPLGGNS